MSTLSTVNVFELTYFYVVPSDALPCVSVFIHTLFIISQVRIAILIMLLERHNVANHAVLKLTATLCQV